jgi:hypothetical protein
MARVVIPAANAIAGTDKVLVRVGSEGIVREIPASDLLGLVPAPDTGALNDAYVPKTGTDAQGNRVVTGIGRAVVGGSPGPKTDPVRVLVDDLWIAQESFAAQFGPMKPFKYVQSSGYRLTDNLVDTASLVANSATQVLIDGSAAGGVTVSGTSYGASGTLFDVSVTPSHSGPLSLLAGSQVTLSWIDKPYPQSTTAFWRLLTGTTTQVWENRALGYQTPVLAFTGDWIVIASVSRATVIPVTAGSNTRIRLQARLDVSGRATAGFSQNTLYGILLKR